MRGIRVIRWAAVTMLLMLAMKVVAQHSNRYQYFFFAAEKQRDAGHWSAAADLYRHCLEIDPTAPEAQYNMAYIQMTLRQDSLGLQYLRRAVEVDSLNVWYLESLASEYIDRRDMESAIPVLEKMSRLVPENTDVLYNLTEIYKSLGRSQEALDVLTREETLDGKSMRISLEKYQLLVDMDRQEEGYAELQALCDEFPNDPTCRILLGDQYVDAGQYERAWAIYNEVIEADPQNVRLQASLLNYYDRTQDVDRFQTLRDSLLYGAGTDDKLRTYLVHDFVQRESRDSLGTSRCLQMFEHVMSAAPAGTGMDQLYAAYVYYMQDSNAAKATLMERILRSNPDNGIALSYLLEYYALTHDFAHLEDICRRGANSYPEEMAYHFYLGVALYQQDRCRDAIDAFQAGIWQKTEESNPVVLSDLYSVMGDAYYELRMERQAFEAYDSALVYKSDNISCLNNYAYYLSLRNERLDEAEEMSYRTVKLDPKNKTYLDTYAWILFMRGEYTEARAYMDRVVSPDSTDEAILADEELSAGVIEHAGDIAWKCGEQELAVRLWSLALQRGQEGTTAALPRKVRQRKYIK